MSHVTLTTEIVQNLGGMKSPAELHNPNGEVIGYFMDAEEFRRMRYQYANSLVSDR